MNRQAILIIGLLLFLEGTLIQTDWSVFGIHSVFLGGIWVHHWIIGLAMMVWAEMA